MDKGEHTKGKQEKCLRSSVGSSVELSSATKPPTTSMSSVPGSSLTVSGETISIRGVDVMMGGDN